MNSHVIGIGTALLIMTGTFSQTSAMACEPARPSASGTQQKGERTEIAKCGSEGDAIVTDERAIRATAARSREFAGTKQAQEIWAEGKKAETQGDYLRAVSVYRQLARQGHGPAAKRLGEIYDAGTGPIKKDFAEALQWYEKARQAGEKVPYPR